MCGIIGCLNPEPQQGEALGLEMLEQIRYRGPDAGYLHLQDNVVLGVRRLAIVNVEHGSQPTFSADGAIAAIFNGEIYNHRELRRELISYGYRLRDGSDAEVIGHAYHRWGLDFASHFNGDFAIAVWDGLRKRMILARDRLGIKPLFYTHAGAALLFASEVKALFVHPQAKRELNPRFLAQLFTFWTGLDTGSAFAGVEQVEAGAVLEFNERGERVGSHKYWDIPYRETVPAFRGDFQDCQWAFRAELRKSVALRLQADVEVGTYTSGGIDSAAVNVVAYKDLGHRQTQTFSVTFADKLFDESEHQRRVARALGLTSNEIQCGANDIYANFARIIWHTESPLFRTAPAPMYLLSRCVRARGLKVVLTGEGSDEITWGYDIFREAKLRRFWSRQPASRARPQLFRKLYAYLPQFQNPRHLQLLVDFFRQDMDRGDDPLYSHHTRIANSAASHVFLSDAIKQALRDAPPARALVDALPPDFSRRSPLEKCQYLEMRTLLQGYLLNSQGDRMLSAHGIEGRFPYLDHHVIEFLAGVPERFRLRGLYDKAILRETFRRDLPQGICERPKFAFRAPELSVFVKDPDGLVASHLSEAAIADAGIFDGTAVQQFRRRLERTAAERFSTRDNLAFVQLLSTQILHRQHVRAFAHFKTRGTSNDVTITRNNGAAQPAAA
jgi:asparagine synthase (glutamine-hydrolysing)